jgi:Ring finger domain
LQNVQSGRYSGHFPRAEPLRDQGSSSSVGHFSQSPSPVRSSQSRGHANRHQSLSFIPGSSNSNPQPHYRSLLDVGNDQYFRTSASGSRPLPPVPHVNEEDECPVCHRVLFSRGQPDFENRRAAHIIQCIDEQIALHSSNSSRPGGYTSQSQPPRASNTTDQSTSPPEPLTPQPPIPTPIANTPEARSAARERAHAAVVLGASSSASSTPPGRRTGMFIYRASEKDCVDDAECTICLEEFEVGASMARLECFCRFHKKCIQGWFVDHPGRCPVHQHDGYGF